MLRCLVIGDFVRRLPIFPPWCGCLCSNRSRSRVSTDLSLPRSRSPLDDRFDRRSRSMHSAVAWSAHRLSSADRSRDAHGTPLQSGPAARPLGLRDRDARWQRRESRQPREPRQLLRQKKSKSVVSCTTPKETCEELQVPRVEPFVRPCYLVLVHPMRRVAVNTTCGVQNPTNGAQLRV
jgi:hypothetical protein